MKIKRASREDVLTLSLISKEWGSRLDIEVNDEVLRKELELSLEKGVVYKLLDKDSIIGYAAGVCYQSPWGDKRIAEEYIMLLHPDLRGQGLGAVLAKSFYGWAVARGCDEIRFTPSSEFYSDAEDMAKNLQKNGFRYFGYTMVKDLKLEH